MTKQQHCSIVFIQWLFVVWPGEQTNSRVFMWRFKLILAFGGDLLFFFFVQLFFMLMDPLPLLDTPPPPQRRIESNRRCITFSLIIRLCFLTKLAFFADTDELKPGLGEHGPFLDQLGVGHGGPGGRDVPAPGPRLRGHPCTRGVLGWHPTTGRQSQPGYPAEGRLILWSGDFYAYIHMCRLCVSHYLCWLLAIFFLDFSFLGRFRFFFFEN